jgi:xanthine/CO dehydrogenase XdhC/CoxF family maturation factor
VPEIALAILAEVVSVRYGGSNLPLSQKGKV